MILDIFPAVERDSAVYGDLVSLRDAVAADPALAAQEGARVRAEVVPARHGGIRRFYWSLQQPCPEAALGFRARTLFYDRERGDPAVLEFPDDPAMGWLTAPDGPLETHCPIAVLRYIPLRRVTFAVRDGAGLPPGVVAKSQKEAALRHARDVLCAVHEAVGRAGPIAFSVPRPVRLDVRRHLLYLEELPGRPLSRVHEELGTHDAVTRLATIHRQLHGLDVPGLGVRRTEDWLASASTAVARIAALLPSLAAQARSRYEALAARVPAEGKLAFCQGDFVPSQILCDPGGWSVLDLDDGHLADPYAEVAALYVALARELSIKDAEAAEQVRRTYLEAYLAAAGERLDDDRWRWHLAVAQLRFLARRLVKGRAVPGEAEAVLAGVAIG